MLNKNIQMKKREGNDWDNLFPITLTQNVYDEQGEDLDQILLNKDSDVEDKISNVENTFNNSLNQTKEDLGLEMNELSELKDENTINAKSNSFIEAIGNGVSTTIQEAYPDVLLSEVKMLDGNADLDSQADWYSLQILINKSLETGKPLYIPKGRYHVDRPLKYSRHLQIRGGGNSSRILSFVNNGYLFEHSENENSSEFIRIENMYLDGTNHTGTGGAIFFKYGGHSSVIRDIWIKYFNKVGQIGVNLLNTWYTYIDKCDISNNATGINLGDETDGVTNGIVIRDTRIDGRLGSSGYQTNSLQGIRAMNATNTIITGCQIENHTHGVRLFSRSCTVENCHFEANKTSSVYSRGVSNVIKDSYFYHNNPNTVEVDIRADSRANVVNNLFGNGFDGQGVFVQLPLDTDQGGGHVVTNIAVDDDDLVADDRIVQGDFTKNKVFYAKRDGTFIDV